jgi:hypothetical protein
MLSAMPGIPGEDAFFADLLLREGFVPLPGVVEKMGQLSAFHIAGGAS